MFKIFISRIVKLLVPIFNMVNGYSRQLHCNVLSILTWQKDPRHSQSQAWSYPRTDTIHFSERVHDRLQYGKEGKVGRQSQRSYLRPGLGVPPPWHGLKTAGHVKGSRCRTCERVPVQGSEDCRTCERVPVQDRKARFTLLQSQSHATCL